MKRIMKTITIAATALSLTLLCSGPLLAQSGNDLYQQALVKERAEGDIQGAIELYQRIAQEFAADRPLAAKALVQMGLCYEKLGQQGARDAYAQVIEEYADQTEEAALARDRLSALAQPPEEFEGVFIIARQLWADAHSNAEAPTPDGQSLVWRDWQGSMDLAVREIATGESRMLTRQASTEPPVAFTYSGRVSPNGETVAYGLDVGGESGGLHVIGMNGANSREIYREPGCWDIPQAWTSDGHSLVTKRDCWSAANPQGFFETILVSVAIGSIQVLKEWPRSFHGHPAFLSPDDRYLVYGSPVEGDGGNADIWILALDGSSDSPLVHHPADDQLLGWLPGTNQVLFLSDRDGTQDLWVATVGGGRLRESPRMVRRNVGQISPVGASDDGSFFYTISTRWFSTNVASFDLSTGTVDEGSATSLLGSNRPPRWSPDSEYLAYLQEAGVPTSRMGRLLIRHLPTGQEQEFAPHLNMAGNVRWSPDGRKVLVAGRDKSLESEDYKGSLYSVDVENGSTTVVLDYPSEVGFPGGISPIWSRDGGSIYYYLVTSGDEGRLMARDLASGQERELYRESLETPFVTPFRNNLDVSPDGDHIVFFIQDSESEGPSAESRRMHLMDLDLHDGSTRRVAEFEASGVVANLQWTPDGERVLWGHSRQGDEWGTDVFGVSASGGIPEHLWTFGEGKYSAHFRVSPNGRQIALTTFAQETEVWVMENLREVLREKEGGD